MAAKIEIYSSGIGFKTGKPKFRWRCRAANGQIVATGHQSFVSRFNAKRAVLNVAKLMSQVMQGPVDVKK